MAINFVENNYKYVSVINNTTDKAVFVFNCLMEIVNVKHGIEVNRPYYANTLGEMVGGTIPAPILTALVKRGLLCSNKVGSKNAYTITTEIYEYYKNIYQPSEKAYIEKLMAR